MDNKTKVLVKDFLEGVIEDVELVLDNSMSGVFYINKLHFNYGNYILDYVKDNKIKLSDFTRLNNMGDYRIENDKVYLAEDNPWPIGIKIVKSNELKSFMGRWKNVNYSAKRVVISHKDCNDGLGAAAAVLFGTESPVEVIFVDYKLDNLDEITELIKGAMVLVCDFSFRKDTHIKLSQICDLQVIDHHESPIAELKEFNNVIIDKRNSGAVLAYHAMHQPLDIPAPYKLIEDRDLFNHIYGDYTDAFMYYLLGAGIFGLKNIMDSNLSMDELKEEINNYNDGAYLEKVQKLKEENLSKANNRSKFIINDINVVGINIDGKVSDLLNVMSRMAGVPSFSYIFRNDNIDKKYSNTYIEFSFRNYTDIISVEELALYLGGGGHKQASGAVINVKSLLLKSFFNGKIIVKYRMSKQVMGIIYYCIKYSNPKNYNVNKDLTKSNIMVTNSDLMLILKHYNKKFNDLFEITKDKENVLHLKIKGLERNDFCLLTDKEITIKKVL